MSKTKEDFRCPICDTVGKWKNMDHVHLKKTGLHSCESCGFFSFPEKYQTEEEIKAYYRKNYRPAPQANNLFTGERKLQYHEFFLQPLFEEWKKSGIDKPVVGEIGAAYGMLLNWVKQHFPDADVHGTELTESFRRVAFHEYGLRLAEDFDTSKKYDMIVSYHVLEHQTDPDLRLTEYASCLKDSGVFYLSAPIWFREASNGAAGGFDIEYHWHPDHINAWADEHLDYVIAKAGLEIVMKNTTVYGNTYILKKTSKTIMKPKFDPKKYVEVSEKIYKCWQLIQENKTAEAIETWHNCPAAWVCHYEFNRKKFHEDKVGLNEFLENAIAACPNSADMYNFVGEVLGRYERYDESINHLQKALSRKPNNPTFIMGIATAYHMKGKKEADPEKKKELFSKALNLRRLCMNISSEVMPTALSWAYQDQAEMPIDL